MHRNPAVTADVLSTRGCAYLPGLLAPNPFLRAGAFDSIELKSRSFGSVREGYVDCKARAVHLGRATPAWNATPTHCDSDSDKAIALFRRTQTAPWPKAPA